MTSCGLKPTSTALWVQGPLRESRVSIMRCEGFCVKPGHGDCITASFFPSNGVQWHLPLLCCLHWQIRLVKNHNGDCNLHRKLTFWLCLLWLIFFPFPHLCKSCQCNNAYKHVRVSSHYLKGPVLVMNLWVPTQEGDWSTAVTWIGVTVEATAAFSSHRQVRICFSGDCVGTRLLLERWPWFILKLNSKQKILMLN